MITGILWLYAWYNATWYMVHVIDIICNYLYFVFVSEYYYLDIYYDIKCYTCTENFCESVAWQMRTMSTNYL